MIKAFLFDVDGVLIENSSKPFSVRYSHDYKIPLEKIMDFIQNEAQLCKVGKADLKEELSKYLKIWGWDKSVDELVEYWNEGEYIVNKKLLAEIDKLRSTGVKCFIASDNEKYRAKKTLAVLEANTHFDGFYFSYELGVTKAQTEFFEKILASLKAFQPSEILLCDDKQRNLDVAASIGIKTYLYKESSGFIKFISMLRAD